MNDLLENSLILIIVMIILIFGVLFILSIIHLKDYKECNFNRCTIIYRFHLLHSDTEPSVYQRISGKPYYVFHLSWKICGYYQLPTEELGYGHWFRPAVWQRCWWNPLCPAEGSDLPRDGNPILLRFLVLSIVGLPETHGIFTCWNKNVLRTSPQSQWAYTKHIFAAREQADSSIFQSASCA